MTEQQEVPNTAETTNLLANTGAIEANDFTQNTNLEVNSDNSLDAQIKRELQDAKSLNSSAASEDNIQGDCGAIKEAVGLVKQERERLDEKPIRGWRSIMPMSQTTDKIRNNLIRVLNWLGDIANNYRKIPVIEINDAWDDAKSALDLIDRLLKDKEKLSQQLAQCDSQWKQLFQTRKEEIDRLNNELQIYNTTSNRLKLEKQQLSEKIKEITQEKGTWETRLAEAEAVRGKLMAELATLKRNTGTHYDGTSHRPQHHILIGEYKTLKEQFLDPLAHRLFKFIAETRPELEQQQKEKTNYIKADISAIVLIGGQAIMKGDRKTSMELPPGMLDEIQNVLLEKLQLVNNIPQEVSELLKKAASLAQGKIEYPTPGKWREQDFQQVSIELRTCLCETLKLNFTSPPQEIQTDIDKAIQNALRFLERAALADPPALLSLDKEGAPFRCDYHEAAKGYDDEGKILKAICPAYLVQHEAKVKAIVLTEPSTPQYSEPLVTTTAEEISIATTSSSIKDDEKERIRLDAKRESVIKQFESKFIHPNNDSSKTTTLLEKLKQINSLSIIETLEDAFCQNPYMNLMEFEQKLNNLLV